MRSSCPFVWLRKRNKAWSGCAVVRQNPFGIPLSCAPRRPTGHTLPIEQLIVFTLADEIIIVKNGRKRRYAILPDAPSPIRTTLYTSWEIIERQHVTVEKILHATPRALRNCPTGVWASACRLPHRKCKARPCCRATSRAKGNGNIYIPSYESCTV